MRAENIRTAAAGALSRSEHPKAREYLMAQYRDQAEGVRITVLHALAARPLDETKPLLLEMAKDESPRVRELAQRYLGP